MRPDVLILDDFAMRQLSAAQADDLCELVSERQGRSLIITSNRAPSDWYPLFPNPVVAESLLDRLINTSHQVIMNGPSYRPNKRPRNPTDKTKQEKPVDVVGILGSRGGRWRSFIRTRRFGNEFGWLCLKRSAVNARLPAAVPVVADGAPVEWGPVTVRRVAVSHEIRWSLGGRTWLGPAQCCADTARHSARRKVRIAGAV